MDVLLLIHVFGIKQKIYYYMKHIIKGYNKLYNNKIKIELTMHYIK